jgi:hypothetical protein
MTDLDMLRRALRVSDGDGYSARALDVDEIRTLGKRLRRRRRLAAVGAGLCVAAAVFGVAAGITHLTRPSSAPAQHPVSPGRTPPGPSRCLPVLSPTGIGTGTPTAVPSPTGIGTSTPTAVSSPTGAGAGTPTAVPSLTTAIPSPTGGGAGTPTAVPSPTTPVPSPTEC